MNLYARRKNGKVGIYRLGVEMSVKDVLDYLENQNRIRESINQTCKLPKECVKLPILTIVRGKKQ